jgi:ornithine decarboxylase
MKCNPDPRLLEHLRGLGCSFEVASYGELAVLREVGVPAAEVLCSNPVRERRETELAFRAGVRTFAFDSPGELRRLAAYAPGARVFVRIATTPAGSKVPSEGKFGVGLQDAVRLMQEAAALGLEPYGIAFHVGSQMLDPGAWARAIADCGALMRELRAHRIGVHMLDLGGGFPARYTEPVPAVAEYADRIRAALKSRLPYQVARTVVEPGRFLVAEAGVLAASVIGVARRGGAWWAHTDVGVFNGPMEVLETRYGLPYRISDSRGDRDKRLFHVTGPTCDSQDTIQYDVPLSAGLTEGDLVCIETAGAYTTAYSSRFNGFRIPSVYCL